MHPQHYEVPQFSKVTLHFSTKAVMQSQEINEKHVASWGEKPQHTLGCGLLKSYKWRIWKHTALGFKGFLKFIFIRFLFYFRPENSKHQIYTIWLFMNLILGWIFPLDQILGIKSKTPGYIMTHIFYVASSLTWHDLIVLLHPVLV